MILKGRCSVFGGFSDKGMRHEENLSLYWLHSQCDARPDLFSPRSEVLTQGTSKRLKNWNALYIAVRFDVTQKEALRGSKWKVKNPKNKKSCLCELVDWGPGEQTNRVADLSDLAAEHLELSTDDEVVVQLLNSSQI